MDLPCQVQEEDEDQGIQEENEDEEKAEEEIEKIEDNADSIKVMSSSIQQVTTGAKLKSPSAGVQPRLMQKISAKKEVTEETLLAGSDIPPLGVKSDYPSELEKVKATKNILEGNLILLLFRHWVVWIRGD